MITKLTVILLFYAQISSGESHDADSSDFNIQSFDQINARQFYPLQSLDANPDIYYGPFRRSMKPCNRNSQNILKDVNEQQWIPTYKQRIIKPILLKNQNNSPGNSDLVYHSLKGDDYDKDNSESRDSDSNKEDKSEREKDVNEPESKIDQNSPSFYEENSFEESRKVKVNKNLKTNNNVQEENNERKEHELHTHEDVVDSISRFQYDDKTDQDDKSDDTDFLLDKKCDITKTDMSKKDKVDKNSLSRSDSKADSEKNLKSDEDNLQNKLVLHSVDKSNDLKPSLRTKDSENNIVDDSLTKMDEKSSKSQGHERHDVQSTVMPETRKSNNEKNNDGEDKSRNMIELVKNSESDLIISPEDKSDRRNNEYIEPTKGRGIVSILDSKMSLRPNSRICYACSTTTNPTCWAPDRGTTVKYCSKDRNACVTKTFQTPNSVVMIRDCARSCDDSPLAPKYKSCSVCHSDLCNDSNSAYSTSINSYNIFLSILMISLIKIAF